MNPSKCLFVICFGSVTSFALREDLRRAPLPPRPLVTRGLVYLHVPCPPYFCHASYTRSEPSPVLYIYSTKYMFCRFRVFPSYTYVQTPQVWIPQTHQTQHTNCVTLLLKTKIQQQCNSKTSPSSILHAYLFKCPSFKKVAPFLLII